MNVLVVGGGAREHALIWKLAQSSRQPTLFAAPGNAGTARLATNLSVSADDLEGLLAAARDHRIDLTVVGPEAPLAAGLVDLFRGHGLRIFGPTREASRIEWSKAFAKETIRAAGAPTAAFEVFADHSEAVKYVKQHGAPIVIKADGLAAGKGVVVAATLAEAIDALDDLMLAHVFGDAGSAVVIEELLSGQEVSVFCFTDGKSVSTLVAACDYKRIGDGDVGANTGGMGGYSPPPWWDDALEKEIRETCIEPVVHQLTKNGKPYSGVLYGGLMLTPSGPSIIEFNARFGDPECQLIVPRLENDLLDVIEAVIEGTVGSLELRWSSSATVGVVLASGGYPGHYETGKQIFGLNDASEGILFHAGTQDRGDTVVTSGGRVLTAVGGGDTIAEARDRAYRTAGHVTFDGVAMRGDIARFAAS